MGLSWEKKVDMGLYRETLGGVEMHEYEEINTQGEEKMET